MISNPVSKFGTYHRAGALILVTLATVVFVYGCGSSDRTESAGPSGPSVNLKPEDYYRYEGEGVNKKKVSLDRREKRKLRFETAKKIEGQ